MTEQERRASNAHTAVEEILPEAEVVPRPCVLIPAYNHSRTLGHVLRLVLDLTPDVIVIDNGSRDHSQEILARFPHLEVLTLPLNRGKGLAIKAGIHRAQELGYTHAITLDANGRYSPRDLPEMLRSMRAHPESLIVGKREWGEGFGVTIPRRLWRKQIGFWVFLATNHRAPDCASSYRTYPLIPLSILELDCTGYDFDIEVLVKAQWIGIEVRSIPVRYQPRRGRISHFRPVRDGLAGFIILHKLLWQRMLLPPAVRRIMHLRTFAEMPMRSRIVTYTRGLLLQESGMPKEIGLSMGIGIFLGILPIWGLQTLAAIAIAQRMRLSKPLMIMAGNISFGVFFPIVIYLSLLTGQLILRGHIDGLEFAAFSSEELLEWLWEYLVGSLVLAVAAGLAAGLASFQLAKHLERRSR